MDDLAHRVAVLVQMFAIGAMAVTAPAALAGDGLLFSLSYAVAQSVVALLYYRAWRQVPEGRRYSRYWGSVFAIGAIIATASAFLPAPASFVGWGLAVCAVLFAPLSKHSAALAGQFPIDYEHLAERYGLLTLIVLGESFVKVLSSLSGYQAEGTLVQGGVTLLITCCLWWIYFDDVAGSKIRKTPFAPVVWLYGHLPLQIAIVAVGVGIKKAVHFDLGATAPDPYRWLLSGALGLVFLSVGVIDSVTERRNAELSDRIRVNVRVFAAALIVVMAAAGSAMNAGTYVALAAAVCLAQVVFDMMSSPLDFDSADDEGATPTADNARRKADGEHSTRPRRPFGQALRKGAPSELRRDIYFYFMEGTWKRFLGALMFLYIVINVFFASLYALHPGSIANAEPENFLDAFFFSVQTLSTIGYGAMSPATDYGNTIVTIEAAIGMLFLALATGLMFAKASRPRGSALFSRVLVLGTRHGEPTLTFRVGNARGNEVVDASITVTVLREELTPEGDHLRRLTDLKLVRDRTPIFTLSWSVMHEIDADSPLAGVDWEGGDAFIAIVIAMQGHDGTYGQTVYSRHTYYPEQVRVNERFVDVISELEDGRLLIDYHRFHETEPMPSMADLG